MATGVFPKLKVGQMIDSSWKLFRAHWRLFVCLSGVVFIPLFIFQQIFGGQVSDPNNLRINSGMFFLGTSSGFSLLEIFVTPFLVGPTMWAAVELVEGREPTFKGSIKAVRKRYWSLLGASAVFALFVGSLGFLIGFVALALLDSQLFSGIISIVIFAVIMMWIIVRAYLFPHTNLIDRLGPWTSIKESFRLTQGYAWRIFLIWATASIFLVLFYFVAIFIVGMIAMGLESAGIGGALLEMVLTLGIAVVTPFITAYTYVLSSIIYVELKARRELAVVGEEVASG